MDMVHPSLSGRLFTEEVSSNSAIGHPAAQGTHPDSTVAEEEDRPALIRSFAAFIYKHGTSRDKTRVVLCHVYNHALHDRFFQARDLMLMSKQQDTIGHTDVSCQLLFNRSLAQLGLAAFRLGFIKECHSCLMELCGTGRAKELLAQGLSSQRFHERNEEQEKKERRRRVPYHMHINLELLDACHLISAMLLEVPNIAAAEHDPRRRKISTHYNRQLEIMEKKTFIGPPETTKDRVMVAGVALSEGDWRKTLDLLLGLRVWDLWGSEAADFRGLITSNT